MERLTQEGLDRLTAALAERIDDPRVPPAAASGYSLRHTVDHAVRGVQAYLDLAADRPDHPRLDSSRARAEELWESLERAADLVGGGAEPEGLRPAGPGHGPGERPESHGGPPRTDPSSCTTLTTARVGRLLILRVTGALDLESAAIFHQASLEGTTAVVLDLSRVDFCDSMGLNMLLNLRTEAAVRGVQVRLAAPSEQVTRVLKLTGADQVFVIHTTIDEAVAVQD